MAAEATAPMGAGLVAHALDVALSKSFAKFFSLQIRPNFKINFEKFGLTFDRLHPNFAKFRKIWGSFCIEIKSKVPKEIWAASQRKSCSGQCMTPSEDFHF